MEAALYCALNSTLCTKRSRAMWQPCFSLLPSPALFSYIHCMYFKPHPPPPPPPPPPPFFAASMNSLHQTHRGRERKSKKEGGGKAWPRFLESSRAHTERNGGEEEEGEEEEDAGWVCFGEFGRREEEEEEEEETTVFDSDFSFSFVLFVRVPSFKKRKKKYF